METNAAADRTKQGPASPFVLVAALAGGALLLAVALASFIHSTGPLPAGAAALWPPETPVSLVQGLPPVTGRPDAAGTANGPWAAFLADARACPGGGRTDVPLAVQASVMVCLVNYARARRGLTPLLPTPALDHSSLAKASRIVGCRQFASAACGRDPASDARAEGYLGVFGENLYLAGGNAGAPRAALDEWLNSARHRENLFRPEWRIEGIAVETMPEFGPYRDAALWVNEFGTG